MIDVGDTYYSNRCGRFNIVDYRNSRAVTIRFNDTGYETIVEAGNIRNGKVKDPLCKTLCGVGFFGIGKYKSSMNGHHTNYYDAWRNMILRCYCEKTQKSHPSYVGCSVDESWHNFQVFSEWFESNYVEGWHLDKDILIDGNKVYSPERCIFVSPSDNTSEASSKHYDFINPDGASVKIYNMSEFCKENNLSNKRMSAVFNGKQKQHKGWTYSEQRTNAKVTN